MNLNPIWGYSITGVPKKASMTFKKRYLFAPDSVLRSSKFRTEMIAPQENSICFLVSWRMPQGCTWVSWSCMSPLFHCSSFFFLLHNPGRGRRAGVTHTQRLICLLVKRNFSSQFRLDPLINSDPLARQKEAETEWEKERYNVCQLNQSRWNYCIKKYLTARQKVLFVHLNWKTQTMKLFSAESICAMCWSKSRYS